MEWIDTYVTGLIEVAGTNDVRDICHFYNIKIVVLNRDSLILNNNCAKYIRSAYNDEVIFIDNELNYHERTYVLAHELGHAILHPDLARSKFNRHLRAEGKLERQANYFALKLLDINICPIENKGLSIEEIEANCKLPKGSLAI